MKPLELDGQEWQCLVGILTAIENIGGEALDFECPIGHAAIEAVEYDRFDELMSAVENDEGLPPASVIQICKVLIDRLTGYATVDVNTPYACDIYGKPFPIKQDPYTTFNEEINKYYVPESKGIGCGLSKGQMKHIDSLKGLK